MFQPDGRNTIQYLGHFGATVSKVFFGAMAFILMAPVTAYFIAHLTVRAQRESVRLWNLAPINAVRLDFNDPGLTVGDIEATKAWFNARRTKANWDTPGISPAFETFPGRLTALAGTPRSATYFWFNLPPSADVINDLTRDRTPLAYRGAREALDPWDVGGRWNLAPGRHWDWGSGEMLLQAKATANYAAYSNAVNIVARMRVWATARHFGRDLSPELAGEGGYWIVPAKAWSFLTDTCPERRGEFVGIYNGLFAGKLPVVVLHLQTLDVPDIRLGNEETYLFRQEPGRRFCWADNFCGISGQGKGGSPEFITGMTLGPSFDRERGRPSWSVLDFALWGTPTSDSGAAAAQEKLQALSSISFWRPLVEAAGLGDSTSLAQAGRILDYLRVHRVKDIKRCRIDAHHIFNHEGNTLNPFRTDADKWNPNNI